MAKDVYGIPYDINKTQMDRQFQLKSVQNGIKFTKKPVTMLTIMIWVVSIIGILYLDLNTFVGRGSIVGAVLFTIGYVFIAYTLSRQDDTHRYGFELLAPYIEYVLKKTRELVLFRNTDLERARKFFGVKSITKKGLEDGLIRMVDGRWAKVFVVVGNASLMMFKEDQDRVLDRTATFYKNISDQVDIIIDTASEPQKVTDQLQHNARCKAHVYDPLLQQLFDEQAYMLKVGVGGYRDETAYLEAESDGDDVEGYHSIHQYLMIIADTKQELADTESAIEEDMSHGGYVFKYVKQLNYKELIQYYKDLYN